MNRWVNREGLDGRPWKHTNVEDVLAMVGVTPLLINLKYLTAGWGSKFYLPAKFQKATGYLVHGDHASIVSTVKTLTESLLSYLPGFRLL